MTRIICFLGIFHFKKRKQSHFCLLTFTCNLCCCLVTNPVQLFCNPMDYNPPGSSVHGISQAKNTRLECHFLLQGIFSTQGSNPSLLNWQVYYLSLSHQGSPTYNLRVHKTCYVSIYTFYMYMFLWRYVRDMQCISGEKSSRMPNLWQWKPETWFRSCYWDDKTVWGKVLTSFLLQGLNNKIQTNFHALSTFYLCLNLHLKYHWFHKTSSMPTSDHGLLLQ